MDAGSVVSGDERCTRLPFENLPIVNAGPGFALLKDVTVIDLTTSIAGPYATMLLSDFGACVIKVERPEGDDARHWGPPFLNGQALWFTAVNRNKKSVVLDLQSEDDRKILMELCRRADVIVTNHPLDVQRKLGLAYENFIAVNPSIIFTSISGFGLSGERASLTCYDLIAEGYSGVMDITGSADRPPQKVGAPAADMLAGQDAAMATIAALYDRRSSGKGRKIDICLVESMTRFLSCRISSYLGSGEVPTRTGGTDSVIAIYRSFNTADEMMNLALGSDAIWRRFWAAVGDPDFGAQPQFRTNADRRERRAEIVAYIQTILLKKRRAEWLEIFAKARVPAGPIYRVDEVAGDRPLQERGLFFTLNDNGRLVPQIGLGIYIDDQCAVPRSAPPLLNEHREAVLGQLTAAGTIDKASSA